LPSQPPIQPPTRSGIFDRSRLRLPSDDQGSGGRKRSAESGDMPRNQHASENRHAPLHQQAAAVFTEGVTATVPDRAANLTRFVSRELAVGAARLERLP